MAAGSSRVDQLMYVLIPAAGNGSRFKQAGYELPKPMIDVLGKPMIERVIDNVSPNGSKVHVITRAEHNIIVSGDYLNVMLDHTTEGAVATLLEAEKYMTEDKPLVIANSDQLVDFDVNDFVHTDLDGRIVVFKSSNPHHSYVTTTADVVNKIVEKEVISNMAVAGVYYFKSSKQFFQYAKDVIEDGRKIKGEYYLSTLIQLYLEDGWLLGAYEADTCILGTPQELQSFLVSMRIGNKLV